MFWLFFEVNFRKIPWVITTYSLAFAVYESLKVFEVMQELPVDLNSAIINDKSLPHFYRISCLFITLGLILGDVLSRSLSLTLWWIFALFYAIRDFSELATLIYTQIERRNYEYWTLDTLTLFFKFAVVGE